MSSKIQMTQEAYNDYLNRIKQAELEFKKIHKATIENRAKRYYEWMDDRSFEPDIMNERIAYDNWQTLKAALDNIEIITPNETDNTIDINSIVTLELDMDGEKEILTMRLVVTVLNGGESETSINGPLGKAIYKKKVNDEVSYKVGYFKIKARILKVE